MKGKVIIGSILALSVFTSIYVVAQSSPGTRKIGSFTCPACVLGYPQPDSKTKNTLIEIRDSFNLGKQSNVWIAVGDIITVCNGSACVDYQVTVGGDGYLGIKHEVQTSTLPPPPISGGGMSGDFGGMGGGDGWWDGGTGGGDPFSGTGTVVVSDPENAQ
ncbi:TPA: hypothetical protein UL761_001439 [Stenotrophomonas maltophilia]|nr:hypothetical protein [Stenotrophomonas maltophilia]